MANLTLRVITPDKVAVDTEVTSVTLPLLDGEAGVLPRHAPMISALDVGLLRFRTPTGPEQEMFVAGGFAEVRNDTVRVVVQSGETAEDIDEERARAAEVRARKLIDDGTIQGTEAVDIQRAQGSLRRAMMRLRTKRGR